MPSDPTDAVQAAVFALLTGTPDLTALVTGVFDGQAPEEAALDYVLIGEAVVTPDGVQGVEGAQVLATIYTWTQALGFAPGNAIGAIIIDALHHRAAALDALTVGHHVWRCVRNSTQLLTVAPSAKGKPGMRQRVDTFRVFTSVSS